MDTRDLKIQDGEDIDVPQRPVYGKALAKFTAGTWSLRHESLVMNPYASYEQF